MWVNTQRSAQSSFQKLNVDNSCQKTRKIRYYIFEVLSNFTVFLYFVPNILSGIVGIKFHLNLTILTFWTKLAQKGYLWLKMKKVNSIIEFCMFELV